MSTWTQDVLPKKK